MRSISALLVASHALAALPLISNVFSSYSVLQRDVNITLWGWTSAPGTHVLVNVTAPSLNYVQAYTALSDANNTWSITTEAQPGSFVPYGITVASADGSSAALSDIAFGDVVLCGGQSNQALPVSYAFNATAEIAAAGAYTDRIRILSVSNSKASSPSPTLPVSQAWAGVTSSNIAAFSALCWFTGRSLIDAADLDYPLGLISSCVGGTAIQSWSTPAGLAACNAPAGQTPSLVLYNGMIAPFTWMAAFPVNAIVWMQGEQNTQQADYYVCGLMQLMDDWRAALGVAPDAFFGVLQLAPWISEQDNNGNDTQVAQLRLAQGVAVDATPGATLVSLIDRGDPTAPATSIHPRDKQHPAPALPRP